VTDVVFLFLLLRRLSDFERGDIFAIVLKFPVSGDEAPASLTGSLLAVFS
jgi:hypothetical protein